MTSSIHDISITNTFANVSAIENRGTNITLEPAHLVTGQQWPTEAQVIMDQAGLEADYAHLTTWLSALKK